MSRQNFFDFLFDGMNESVRLSVTKYIPFKYDCNTGTTLRDRGERMSLFMERFNKRYKQNNTVPTIVAETEQEMDKKKSKEKSKKKDKKKKKK